MLTISKPLSATQARNYHAKEFASQQQNYWSRDQQGHSEWQGRLAGQWNLNGPVHDEHFARLAEGQHPQTAEQLVRHQVSRTYEGKNGKEVTSVEHRAGWDATFSAPKSVSITALVGGDDRVRLAHRESVRAALAELERYTQARIGNVHAPETTGKLAAATFEHDTARPVDGYAAPQLHTHAVIFNVTERENGQTRALQPHEIFVSQRYATAVYRSELALRLEKLGYELERGKHGQPEIKGYTKEYLEASSPRREQIKDHLREQGIDGAAAAQIAAHHTRDRKELLSQEEVLRRHRDLAVQYGNQADRVVAQARAHGQYQTREPEIGAQRAVTWARDHLFERSAVHDRRAILESALARSMGETKYASIRQEFERRVRAGEFREVAHHGVDVWFTTTGMIRMEHEIIARMHEGNRHSSSDPMLVSPQARIRTEDRHPELSAAQRTAVDDILISREKILGLDGVAGAGKTTVLSVIREAAVSEGYRIEGFAPTSRATQKLAEAGMETSTLQKHLARGEQHNTGEKRLYVLDESSLASTRQLHGFVHRLQPNDRVLLVGDRRQHEAVEAGRPFAQLQDAGMVTVKLEEIVRQKDPQLKKVVEQLARGQVHEAVESLDRQRRVHEIADHDIRIRAIAQEYANSAERTLVVSPDNRSRMEINESIHAELQNKGVVRDSEHHVRTLVPRQNMTGADRTWAERYEVGDVLRYSRASKETGIGKGEYAQVKTIDAAANRLTVELRGGTERTYDPRRQQGVTVYREELRAFSEGDRIQFTAPASDLKVANRELGSVEQFGDDKQLRLKLDDGRSVQLDPNRQLHLDYGYAVTSHSSQGQTADRVLIHVDTELGAKDLLNSRMAYVAVSRGAHDAQIFTNDATALGTALSHDVSHAPAIQQAPIAHAIEQVAEQRPAHEHEIGHGFGLGM
ncbi:MAG TPA: MobF family relaxase [Acidobacteriaceae bacterium]|jgi:conjugative relaxase-like TrwC/TraI family protein|nr:MobF family relaxase [Acidobacteriaceae bacterium]